MAKRGRPLIEIDEEKFEKLCFIHCTLEEISGFFNCSEDTVERWCKREYKMNFAVIYKQKSSRGKISLRRWQWRRAEEGDKTMLIWLGKQELGQRDKLDNQVTGYNNGPIDVEVSLVDKMKKYEHLFNTTDGDI